MVFVILANRGYRILTHNLDGSWQRCASGSNQAYMNMYKTGPDPGIVEMAGIRGTDGWRFDGVHDLHTMHVDAFTADVPGGIEAAVESKH